MRTLRETWSVPCHGQHHGHGHGHVTCPLICHVSENVRVEAACVNVDQCDVRTSSRHIHVCVTYSRLLSDIVLIA